MDFLLKGEETERLIFRNVLHSDFEAWLPFYHDSRSTQFWNGLPKNPEVACKEQFQRIFERYDKGEGGMNTLLLKSTRELVGLCGLLIQKVDDVPEMEIGYSVLPKFWKQGYAYEAAQKCKEYAFANQMTRSLISIIHVANAPSQKVALKLGMNLDKTTTYKENPVHIFRILNSR